jgi:DNA-binding response OmpR family regulator
MSAAEIPEPYMHHGKLIVWLATLRVSTGLTTKKHRLEEKVARTLLFLLTRRGEMLNKSEVLHAIYDGKPPGSNLVDTYVCRLRKALDEIDPGASGYVHTTYGDGIGLFEYYATKKAVRS